MGLKNPAAYTKSKDRSHRKSAAHAHTKSTAHSHKKPAAHAHTKSMSHAHRKSAARTKPAASTDSDSEPESNSESSDDESTRRNDKQKGRHVTFAKGTKKQSSEVQEHKDYQNPPMWSSNEHGGHEMARQEFTPRYSTPAGTPPPDHIIDPRPHVVHVEHSFESPRDPRPNAFYDNGSDAMRVYHGPVYGNPQGVLYPRTRDVPHPQRALPSGAPHPSYNPWYHGFPPQQGERQASAPPGPPPPPPTDTSRWFQGWGTTTADQAAPSSPDKTSVPDMPPIPEFPYDSSKFDKAMRDNFSPDMNPNGRSGMDSNVFPSVGATRGPSSSHRYSSRRRDDGWPETRMDHPELWGTQSAPEPPENAIPSFGDHHRKRSRKRHDDPFNFGAGSAFENLEEIMARDKARMKASQEKWARLSSNESSPEKGWNGGNVDGSADRKNNDNWGNNGNSSGNNNGNDNWGNDWSSGNGNKNDSWANNSQNGSWDRNDDTSRSTRDNTENTWDVNAEEQARNHGLPTGKAHGDWSADWGNTGSNNGSGHDNNSWDNASGK